MWRTSEAAPNVPLIFGLFALLAAICRTHDVALPAAFFCRLVNFAIGASPNLSQRKARKFFRAIIKIVFVLIVISFGTMIVDEACGI